MRNLIQILSLVGQDVDLILADIRSRKSNGEPYINEKPCFRSLKKVEIKVDQKGTPWLYWTHYKIEPTECDFSGIQMGPDNGNHLNYFIEIKDGAAFKELQEKWTKIN